MSVYSEDIFSLLIRLLRDASHMMHIKRIVPKTVQICNTLTHQRCSGADLLQKRGLKNRVCYTGIVRRKTARTYLDN